MLEDFKKEMMQFITDMENKIKDEETLVYMIKRTEKLFDTIMDTMNTIIEYKKEEINNLETRQDKQQKRMDEIDERLKFMYDDIYEGGEDFEIVCPYCNFKFDAFIDENEKEITCPECGNIIELDWNENDDENN